MLFALFARIRVIEPLLYPLWESYWVQIAGLVEFKGWRIQGEEGVDCIVERWSDNDGE